MNLNRERRFVRKLPLIVGAIIGAAIGLLTSLADAIGVKIVMMLIGALAGAAVGGAIGRIGTKRPPLDEAEESYGLGTSPEDRMRNFWRDKGKLVPFFGPPDTQGTRHDFDRERL
jgi:hypothetical protein